MASFNGSTRPFDDDGYLGYDPRLASQRFNSISHFDGADSPPTFAAPPSYSTVDDFFSPQPLTETPSPPPMYSSAGGYSAFSPDQNGEISDGDFGSSNGPVLPEMPPEDGFALREWRRQNAIRLAEKEIEEKEMLQQIIKEAEEYKAEFYRKRKIVCENNKVTNREKEKLFLENGEKFHAEAEKNYWKAIAELIPREVPAIEKKGKKKDEKKPSVVVIQGPKPGKPTDLSRMRQILGKLKNNPPLHMKSPPEPKKDAKTDSSTTAAVPSKAAAPVVAATPEALAAA